jgi:isopentenyl diphosphate isomerase/L-lactate dehydrogenase-like FMN-dependent dehydrogenase
MKKALTRRQALAGFGSLAAATSLQAADAPKLIGEPPGRIAPRDELVNVLEFESVAERMVAPVAFSHIAGSDRSSFDRITFRPRMMVPTTNLDMTVELFGVKMFAPIMVGPTARQQSYHPEGELAMARGAAAAKTVMIASSDSSYPIEKIAAEAKAGLWYQIFPEGEIKAVQAQIQQAVSCGCKAICLTVGAPYRNGRVANTAIPALNWSVVDQLRQGLTVPFLLKGIMTAQEADAAVKHGVQGVIVSDYGGLLTKGMASPMETLPAIVDVVSGRAPVLVDGNFRRGSDIFKALAFGARAVLLGRPPLWGLAAYGAPGVQSVLEMLQTEVGRDMAQCGKPTLRAIDRTAVKVHEI